MNNMRISTKVMYGAKAALELSLRYGSGPVIVHEIAEIHKISWRYLEQILNTLRISGLVISTRGAKGGYELTKAPSEITIGDIVRSLEGPFDVVSHIRAQDFGKVEDCVTFFVWKEVNEAIENVLNSITLEELAAQHRKVTKHDHPDDEFRMKKLNEKSGNLLPV